MNVYIKLSKTQMSITQISGGIEPFGPPYDTHTVLFDSKSILDMNYFYSYVATTTGPFRSQFHLPLTVALTITLSIKRKCVLTLSV